jgi:membrane protein
VTTTAKAERRREMPAPSPDRRRVAIFGGELVGIGKEAATRWVDDACYRLGASLAFYAVFSIFPLALLAVTVVGFLLGDDDTVRSKVLAWFSNASSPQFRDLLDQTLQSMQTHRTARGLGAVVGIVTLLIGASGVFSELQTSLNTIWRVKAPETRGFWSTVLQAAKDKALSFAVVGVAAVALLASLAAGTLLSAIGSETSRVTGGSIVWHLLEMAGSFALLTLFLAAIFRMIPQMSVRWSDVVGGAALTALLFVALKSLLAWYLANLGSYAAYGAVGAVLGLLMWIYLASLILFFGAEFTRVYAERFGSVAASKPRTADAHD